MPLLILSPTVLKWRQMTRHWYQWVLFGIIVCSVLVGTLYVIYSLVTRIVLYFRTKPVLDLISLSTRRHLGAVQPKLARRKKPLSAKVASFSIYLGDFDDDPTAEQLALLQRSDLNILDPWQGNVRLLVEEIADRRQYFGRIDVESLSAGSKNVDHAAQSLVDAVVATCNDTTFDGLVFAGLDEQFSLNYCREVLDFIDDAGIVAYLEVKFPNFLHHEELVSHPAVCGLVVRNAVILPTGEHRDYFDMQPFQPTLKACIKESCLRPFNVLSLEVFQESATPSNAVLKRGMSWCGFYSAIVWAGPETALYRADLNMPSLEPLGAFEWLKEDNVMSVHSTWRENTLVSPKMQRNKLEAWEDLIDMFPHVEALLTSHKSPNSDSDTATLAGTKRRSVKTASHVPSASVSESLLRDYKGLGCWPLGVEVSPLAFAEVLESLLHLRRLDLLHPVGEPKVADLGILYRKFLDRYLISEYPHDSDVHDAVKEIATLAQTGRIEIHVGLNPSFKYGRHARFWGVYLMDGETNEIYISKDAQGLAGTVLHTFLSYQGFPRETCLEIETALALWSEEASPSPSSVASSLPKRFNQDIDLLTPVERLLLLQQLKLSGIHNPVTGRISAMVRATLIEAPSLAQLAHKDSFVYISGKITARELLEARFDWYKSQAVSRPHFEIALMFFKGVETSLSWMLRNRRDVDLSDLAHALDFILEKGAIDAWADILALAVFCAARKAAFDEVYLEVTDRNPLLNDQSDQAAAFAECFALGSRCETYFDVTPGTFGKLLSDRFRQQYAHKQPPSWVNGAPEFATAYGGAGIDIDPHGKSTSLPQFQRFTFLSVFAIPALVDIALLTTTGRGLYLSAFMTFDQQQAATIALMAALLLSGAIGTWIAVGGNYYLISMAFSAMNLFVLNRLILGVAVALAGSIIGFCVLAGVKSFSFAIVFALYLTGFTTYLILFAALACFQFPGSAFLSGRTAIILSLPTLLISPILTMWSGYDIVVYMIVFYIVIGSLAINLRRIGGRWITWYHGMRKTDDAEIKRWFTEVKAGGDPAVLGRLTDPGALKASREALLQDVIAETQRGRFSKPTKDKLVRELAEWWEATNFLLDWYCRYSDVPRSIPFSSAWNIQTKVGLQTLSDAQKGIRLHSAFIHWRQASMEIGCGILYFVVALMDKWVEMLSGVHLLGLSASLNSQFRSAIGFGLAYYLIGAVLIDFRAQDLHNAVSKAHPVGIENTAELWEHQRMEVATRRKMYTRTLMRYLLWHCWSLAFATTIVWILSDALDGTIMFFGYAGAYTGLLWYQYTKIFAGPHALKPLLAAIFIALPLGLALKRVAPDFIFSSVIALAVCTWTAAILCLFNAKLELPKRVSSGVEEGERYHAHVKPWADPEWSQEELKAIFDRLDAIPPEARFSVTPEQHPGAEVVNLLHSYESGGDMGKAFPDVEDLVNVAMKAWESGQVRIELVALARMGEDIRAVSRWTDGSMTLIIGVGKGAELPANIRSNCHVIAEILLHETSEGYFQVDHKHAGLAELLISDGVPQNLKNLLAEEVKHEEVLAWAKREMLKQQCLGIDCDLKWDTLSKSTRKLFMKRCLGEDCELTDAEFNCLQQTLAKLSSQDFSVHVARCELALDMAARTLDHAFLEMTYHDPSSLATPELESVPDSMWYYIKRPFSFVYHLLGGFTKFFVIAMNADLEYQRELEFALSAQPRVIRAICGFVLNAFWRYGYFCQSCGLRMFLFSGRPNVARLWKDAKGTRITQKHDRLIIKGPQGDETAFRREDTQGGGGFQLFHYKGSHHKEPKDTPVLLQFTTTYDKKGCLIEKEDYEKGVPTNAYEYDYDFDKEGSFFNSSRKRMPIGRRCLRGAKYLEHLSYNSKGLVESGSYLFNGNLIYFKLEYRKNAEHTDGILRGEFTMAHLSARVSWCAPPKRSPEKKDRWIPHNKVLRAQFIEGGNTYDSKWHYDHKFHPTISTKLNGEEVDTPPMIEHDWLNVLKRPCYGTFFDENPLYRFSTWSRNRLVQALGLSTQLLPISTSHARGMLWKEWKKSKELDGVILRYLDERMLRHDAVMRPYWRYRNRGNLAAAREYIQSAADAIMASADLDGEISSWTPLAIKLTDLLTFGTGGDAIMVTKAQNVGMDTKDTLHVLASDNGTWPNEGGGVSACRRDVVNGLKSIRWHMLCESATDYGLPKHQTEQNVLSLKIVALWGLDFLTPTHGLFKNRLDAEVNMIRSDATDLDIKREFIPALTALVKGARAIDITSADIQQATRALINLNDCFADRRHWGQVWQSDVSKDAWRSLWLKQDMPNSKPSTEWLDTELPTLGHLDTAMELWLRYLFVFSMKVPDKVPAVFQASHHSVSAAYGVICKVRRGCQLQIWDHAIAWRETNMCLSSTLCKLAPFVRNSLLGLMRLTSVIILHHADVLLPCADFFNPGWEVEVGTCQGTLEHRNSFKRKIAPVVNGITDADKFKPVTEILTKKPTVTMLSHLWFCKDLKTAILAADIIVNEWGFRDYQLDVYGSIEKAPIYSNECQELIASKSLRAQVRLAGTADPIKVLEQTWLFLNSSVSEGLPLALGEAALTGAPVVCTDVGASLRVLSDPDDFSRYSAVVAPNDARALARAQIKMLAMLGEWGKYAEDEGPSPDLPFAPTPEDVQRITARMYEKDSHRRKLGMMSREIVQKSFGGERYLREHEQMLWIGKAHHMMEERMYGELELMESEDVMDFRLQIRELAPPEQEVITRSTVPSWRSSSPAPSTVYNRASTPVSSYRGDAIRTSNRLTEAMRSTSRLSFESSRTDRTSASQQLMLSGHGRSHHNDDLDPSNLSGSAVKRAHLSSRPSTYVSAGRSQRSSGRPTPYMSSTTYQEASSMYNNPFDEQPAPQKEKPKRADFKDRVSDSTSVALEVGARYLTPMS